MRFHLTRRDDKRQTTNKQGKIVLLSLWAVGRLSFAIRKNTFQNQDPIVKITFRCPFLVPDVAFGGFWGLV